MCYQLPNNNKKSSSSLFHLHSLPKMAYMRKIIAYLAVTTLYPEISILGPSSE